MQNKVFIGILGSRNQGKSSLINSLCGGEVSIVSALAGTTTDSVKKSIEIFGIGSCVLVDSAGWDDEGEIGEKRVEKTKAVIKTLDLAIVVFSGNGLNDCDIDFCNSLKEAKLPFVLLHNKCDLGMLNADCRISLEKQFQGVPILEFSSVENKEEHIERLFEQLRNIAPEYIYRNTAVLKDIVFEGDSVLLVTPIDAEAPEGRLILPQVKITRQCLDLGAIPSLCQVAQLKTALENCKTKPKLIITDSQAFAEVDKIIPKNQALTSFSICLAKEAGPFEIYLQGTPFIERLQDGDRILMLESCTHQVNCHDIGRFKLPNLLKKKTGKKLEFDFVSGLNPIDKDLRQYAMAIQCGGCMVSGKQLTNRLKDFIDKNIPISNYGMSIAYCTGIFERATAVFK